MKMKTKHSKNHFNVFSYRKSKTKKASLSLSINAIVILVLAIAMLGLGLAFTKSMFKKFSSKLSVPPPDLPASADEPIVLPMDELEVKHGKEFVFAVNFYNDHSQTRIIPYFYCFDPLNEFIATGNVDAIGLEGIIAPDPDRQVIAAPQRIETGTYKTFKFIIPPAATTMREGDVGDITGKQAVCEVTFCPAQAGSAMDGDCTAWSESKQVTVKIT